MADRDDTGMAGTDCIRTDTGNLGPWRFYVSRITEHEGIHKNTPISEWFETLEAAEKFYEAMPGDHSVLAIMGVRSLIDGDRRLAL